MVSAYRMRADFEIKEGNPDQAMAYLRTMMEYAKKVPQGEKHILNGERYAPLYDREDFQALMQS